MRTEKEPVLSYNLKLILTFFLAIFLLELIAPLPTHGSPVSMEKAKTIAQNWMRRQNLWNYSLVSSEEIMVKGTKIGYLFVFDPEGWVVVPSDDALAPIKAWSDHGSFSGDMREFVEKTLLSGITIAKKLNRKKQKAYANSVRRKASAWRILAAKSGYFQGEAEKLDPVVATRWNQWWPYNKYTPICESLDDQWWRKHCPTGCGPTAFSQIMRYWRWPDRGIGSHCYTAEIKDGQETYKVELCASFDHTYDWNAMPDTLSDENSDYEIDQVARLMSDIGIAAEAGYTSEGTGSWPVETLRLYFKYSRYLKTIHTDNIYAQGDEWFNIFKENLDRNPPEPVILVAGHFFIADGYLIDAGMRQIHLNVGWGGHMDGWYTFETLIDSFSFVDQRMYAHINIKPEYNPVDLDVKASTDCNLVYPGISDECSIRIEEKNGIPLCAFVSENGLPDWLDGNDRGCSDTGDLWIFLKLSDKNMVPGHYSKNVRVILPNSTSDHVDIPVSLTINSKETIPVVDSFTADPPFGEKPTTITFRCQAHDPDGQVVSYLIGWKCCPHEVDNGVDRWHITWCGTFEIYCSAVDNDGKQSFPAKTTAIVYVKGDASFDCNVDIVDALITAMYSIGFAPEGSFEPHAADVNENGEIDTDDAVKTAIMALIKQK